MRTSIPTDTATNNARRIIRAITFSKKYNPAGTATRNRQTERSPYHNSNASVSEGPRLYNDPMPPHASLLEARVSGRGSFSRHAIRELPVWVSSFRGSGLTELFQFDRLGDAATSRSQCRGMLVRADTLRASGIGRLQVELRCQFRRTRLGARRGRRPVGGRVGCLESWR